VVVSDAPQGVDTIVMTRDMSIVQGVDQEDQDDQDAQDEEVFSAPVPKPTIDFKTWENWPQALEAFPRRPSSSWGALLSALCLPTHM
jgi:hypothetical protein